VPSLRLRRRRCNSVGGGVAEGEQLLEPRVRHGRGAPLRSEMSGDRCQEVLALEGVQVVPSRAWTLTVRATS
jgi:hypothetical protein